MNSSPKPSTPHLQQATRIARQHARQHVAEPPRPIQKAPWWDTMRTEPEREYDRLQQEADARDAERKEGLEVGALDEHGARQGTEVPPGNPARVVGYGGTLNFEAVPMAPDEAEDQRLRVELSDLLLELGAEEFSGVVVEVQGKVVSLTGTVASRLLKYRCEEIVDQVDGLKDVHNHLVVWP